MQMHNGTSNLLDVRLESRHETNRIRATLSAVLGMGRLHNVRSDRVSRLKACFIIQTNASSRSVVSFDFHRRLVAMQNRFRLPKPRILMSINRGSFDISSNQSTSDA